MRASTRYTLYFLLIAGPTAVLLLLEGPRMFSEYRDTLVSAADVPALAFETQEAVLAPLRDTRFDVVEVKMEECQIVLLRKDSDACTKGGHYHPIRRVLHATDVRNDEPTSYGLVSTGSQRIGFRMTQAYRDAGSHESNEFFRIRDRLIAEGAVMQDAIIAASKMIENQGPEPLRSYEETVYCAGIGGRLHLSRTSFPVETPEAERLARRLSGWVRLCQRQDWSRQ